MMHGAVLPSFEHTGGYVAPPGVGVEVDCARQPFYVDPQCLNMQ